MSQPWHQIDLTPDAVTRALLEFDLDPPEDDDYTHFDFGVYVAEMLPPEAVAEVVRAVLRAHTASLASSFIDGIVEYRCSPPVLETLLESVGETEGIDGSCAVFEATVRRGYASREVYQAQALRKLEHGVGDEDQLVYALFLVGTRGVEKRVRRLLPRLSERSRDSLLRDLSKNFEDDGAA